MATRLSQGAGAVRSRAPGSWRRRCGWLLLLLAVIMAHGCVGDRLRLAMAGPAPGVAPPARIEVVFVRELALADPAPVAFTAAPAPRPAAPTTPLAITVRRSAEAPALAASAVAEVDADPQTARITGETDGTGPALERLASAPPSLEPRTELRTENDGRTSDEAHRDMSAIPAPTASAPAASSPDGAVSIGTGEEADWADDVWPASTRLSYDLSGHVRGDIQGTAQVLWLRDGLRYQVHMDVTLGLAVAPVMSRQISSEGRITAHGLAPERYDEETMVAFRGRRHATVRMAATAVMLSNGQWQPAPPGLQDSASQFVQLSWLFTTQPALLAPGRSIDMPLALPRRVEIWVYDVMQAETIDTPFGPVDAVAVKPRRPARAGNDLVAEAWFAPQLRHLPVRIRITQDAETYLDMVISRPPEQAER